MSEQLFLKALKSTIDKIGYDLGQLEAPPISFIDLDNTVNVEELLQSEETALVWELTGFSASPKDPLYRCHLSVGARTVNDPANYEILDLTGTLIESFSVGTIIDIKDYTGTVAGAKLGVLSITSSVVTPQQFDKVSGIRLTSFNAVAARFG